MSTMLDRLKQKSMRDKIVLLLSRAHEFPSGEMLADELFSILREPTPRMLMAGRRVPPEPDPNIRYGSADCDVNPIRGTNKTLLRYQAMIDAASQ